MSCTKAYVDATVMGSTITVISGPGGFNQTGATFKTLSPAEQLELEHLNTERDNLLKINRLNKFKSWPHTVRETVVEYIKTMKLVDDITSEDLGEEHLHIDKRIAELRAKSSSISYIYVSAADQMYVHPYVVNQLLSLFSKEELLNAHAEQSLEEQLSNPNRFDNKP